MVVGDSEVARDSGMAGASVRGRVKKYHFVENFSCSLEIAA